MSSPRAKSNQTASTSGRSSGPLPKKNNTKASSLSVPVPSSTLASKAAHILMPKPRSSTLISGASSSSSSTFVSRLPRAFRTTPVQKSTISQPTLLENETPLMSGLVPLADMHTTPRPPHITAPTVTSLPPINQTLSTRLTTTTARMRSSDYPAASPVAFTSSSSSSTSFLSTNSRRNYIDVAHANAHGQATATTSIPSLSSPKLSPSMMCTPLSRSDTPALSPEPKNSSGPPTPPGLSHPIVSAWTSESSKPSTSFLSAAFQKKVHSVPARQSTMAATRGSGSGYTSSARPNSSNTSRATHPPPRGVTYDGVRKAQDAAERAEYLAQERERYLRSLEAKKNEALATSSTPPASKTASSSPVGSDSPELVAGFETIENAWTDDALLDVKLPYDLDEEEDNVITHDVYVESNPATPLVSPHSPTIHVSLADMSGLRINTNLLDDDSPSSSRASTPSLYSTTTYYSTDSNSSLFDESCLVDEVFWPLPAPPSQPSQPSKPVLSLLTNTCKVSDVSGYPALATPQRERDEVTRSLVSAVNHMLDDNTNPNLDLDVDVCPPSASSEYTTCSAYAYSAIEHDIPTPFVLSPLSISTSMSTEAELTPRNEKSKSFTHGPAPRPSHPADPAALLPAVHLHLPRTDCMDRPRSQKEMVMSGQGPVDVSSHMPAVHGDVSAAYWALHHVDGMEEFDVDQYFTQLVSPV